MYTDLITTQASTYKDWCNLLGPTGGFDNYTRNYKIRESYISKVGFPIITKEVVQLLARGLKGKKVVEVGAGSGFLSHQLMQESVYVIPVDTRQTKYCHATWQPYCPILHEDALTLDLTDFEAVIMSWPDYNNPFAATIAKNMKVGQYLIYQGESWGGCTGDEAFFEYLSSNFKSYCNVSNKLNEVHIQFNGIHDNWEVYKKIAQ